MIGAHRGARAGGNGASDGTAQVVLGISVAPGKIGTGEPEDIVHLGGGCAVQQQVAGNPEIHDAPIGLGKALLDVPKFQQIVIDLLGRGRSDGGGRSVWENGAWKGGTLCLDRCRSATSPRQGYDKLCGCVRSRSSPQTFASAHTVGCLRASSVPPVWDSLPSLAAAALP